MGCGHWCCIRRRRAGRGSMTCVWLRARSSVRFSILRKSATTCSKSANHLREMRPSGSVYNKSHSAISRCSIRYVLSPRVLNSCLSRILSPLFPVPSPSPLVLPCRISAISPALHPASVFMMHRISVMSCTFHLAYWLCLFPMPRHILPCGIPLGHLHFSYHASSHPSLPHRPRLRSPLRIIWQFMASVFHHPRTPNYPGPATDFARTNPTHVSRQVSLGKRRPRDEPPMSSPIAPTTKRAKREPSTSGEVFGRGAGPHTLAVCAVCLGHHRHEIAKCSSATLWSGNVSRCTRNP